MRENPVTKKLPKNQNKDVQYIIAPMYICYKDKAWVMRYTINENFLKKNIDENGGFL